MMRIIMCLLTLSATQVMAQPEPDESDPLIAAVIAYSQAYAIERWENYCGEVNPETADTIATARTQWMEAHAALMDKASRILQSQYTKEERTSIAVQARLANNELEDRLAAASEDQRSQWCEETPLRIGDPRMSLMENPVLVDAIMQYEPDE